MNRIVIFITILLVTQFLLHPRKTVYYSLACINCHCTLEPEFYLVHLFPWYTNEDSASKTKLPRTAKIKQLPPNAILPPTLYFLASVLWQ
jgi:hypothetical protein